MKTTGSIRLALVLLVQLLCLIALGCAALTKGESLKAYARRCAEAIAPVEPFNCMQGEVIPITVNGQEPRAYTPDMTCDRPSLLPLGRQSDGQCVPYSRAILLADGETQITALCRQKYIRTKHASQFDEIDVIAHSVKTGATCWFRATATSADGLDGAQVPSPQSRDAADFWNSPADVASEQCGRCHDSDPFMYSPFIGQVYSQVPADPFGWYVNIGKDFEVWPHPKSIDSPGNTCTGCHRIGSEYTCRTGILESVGQHPSAADNAWARHYPNSHWMPLGNLYSQAGWDVVYNQSVEELSRCCQDPTTAGCVVRDISGRP